MENPLLEAGSLVHSEASGRVPSRWQITGAHRGTVPDGFFRARESRDQHAGRRPARAGPTRTKSVPGLRAASRLKKIRIRMVDAIAAYHRVLELDPNHAAAHINLGTLYYNRQDFGLAESHYRQAIEADPRYALAYFDLGNVLDETGRVQEAVQTYKTALQLAPTYADAHYNLALAFEKLREPRKALKHWQAYVKLDTSGPWSVHARSQIKRILQADALRLVYKRA